ncbi:MAG: hypothetical protein ACJAUV_000568 [Flavobacteriales bacterium]|jgi:hypothetical protein
MKWLRWIVFSNIYIALAAGLMMQQSCKVLHVDGTNLSLLTFFGTLFLYNFHRLYRFRKARLIKASRYQWVVDHRAWLVILAIIGTVGGFYTVQFLHLPSFLFLIILGIISLAYVVEFIGKKKPRKALRDISGMKILVVAGVWSAFMVFLPVVQFELPYSDTSLLFLEKLLFIFAITIPFDIRDVNFDKLEQKTLPQVIGVKASVGIGVFALTLAIVFVYLQTNLYSTQYMFGQLIAYGIAICFVVMAKKKRNELFYSFLVDGTMIISAVFGILLS